MLRQAMKGVTRMLGAKVWDYTLIGLTHGRVLPPTLDQTYGEDASLRSSDVDLAPEATIGSAQIFLLALNETEPEAQTLFAAALICHAICSVQPVAGTACLQAKAPPPVVLHRRNATM